MGSRRKGSESVSGFFPEFFRNFFRKVPAVLGAWPIQARKRHVNIISFWSGCSWDKSWLSQEHIQFVRGTLSQTQVFSLLYTVEAQFVPGQTQFVPGRSWVQRAAERVYVLKGYLPFSLAKTFLSSLMILSCHLCFLLKKRFPSSIVIMLTNIVVIIILVVITINANSATCRKSTCPAPMPTSRPTFARQPEGACYKRSSGPSGLRARLGSPKGLWGLSALGSPLVCPRGCLVGSAGLFEVFLASPRPRRDFRTDPQIWAR